MFILRKGIAIGLLAAAVGMIHAEERVDFERDIRPILSDRCFKCHGFDDETREADLGLHTFEMATRDLGGYRAIDLKNPEKSELLYRVTSHDEDDVMPPPAANKPKLSPEEVALFRKWIEQGAEYKDHWSFVPPVKPNVPAAKAGPHPIDAFVDQTLSEKGLSANDRADAYTLIRRLSLDLRGLPPSVEETEAFVVSYGENPDAAWSNLIDQFLSSKAYGEKWAREWLDLARYADTNGYEKDRERSIWPYRDWVINALNDDLPFDEFTIEQLAGDMLPNATLEQRVATGFHRNTMLNEEGGIDPLEYRYHAMVDRVATTGTVWMGLTTGCAQCHTHKFDPVTHTDYFALMGLLNNADEPEIDVPNEEIGKQRAAVEKQVEEIEDKAMAGIEEPKFQKWLAEQKKLSVEWTDLQPTSAKSNLPRLEILDDHSVYASGDFTKRDVYDLVLDLTPFAGKEITAIRLEALPDDRLPAKGPGAAYYEGRKGDFFLSEVTAKTKAGPVSFKGGSVSFGKISVGSGTAEGMNVFDGDGSTGWSTSSQEGKSHELVLNLEKGLKGGGDLEVQLLFERHFVAALGRFRFSASTDSKEAVAKTDGIPNAAKTSEEEMRRAYVRTEKAFEKVQKEITALEAKMPAYPTTLVMHERPADNPRPTFYHHRGEYLKAKQEVQPAVPAIFEPIPADQPKNRLGFARWLVSERNPLVARVTVNRAWRSFFGRGIVHTSGDFGYQSELPSHPELLDWLAVTFVENGWSLKELHRLIVTSETYQRGSEVPRELLEADPTNIWLARGPRYRLSGETIRDLALEASGLLVERVGGASVYPPQPKSVTDLAYGKFDWKVKEGPDRYRRSLYTFTKRTAPFAAYLTFDGPTGESCLARRERSNTPLQALTLLNDPMFGEASVALAEIAASKENPRAAAEILFRRILTRPPSKSELTDLVNYYEEQLARLQSGELNAGKILSADEKAPVEEAAWKMVSRALLNLSETVTKS